MLDELHTSHWRLTVIQGGARGADRFALEWRLQRLPTIHLVNEPADWEKHGRAAGPIRNKKMLNDHKPDVVYAFPGGRGTVNMIKQAEAAGVHVVRAMGEL